MTLHWCAACGLQRERGELLLVTDRGDPRQAFTVCRPSVRPSCIVDAGPREGFTIEMLDADAAREVDATGVEYEPRHGRRAHHPQTSTTGAEQTPGGTPMTSTAGSQPSDPAAIINESQGSREARA